MSPLTFSVCSVLEHSLYGQEGTVYVGWVYLTLSKVGGGSGFPLHDWLSRVLVVEEPRSASASSQVWMCVLEFPLCSSQEGRGAGRCPWRLGECWSFILRIQYHLFH